MVYKQLEAADRTELRALQTDRLQGVVTHAYENVPFYREKLDEAGVSPEDIQSIDDITKLPMTTKEDFRDEYPDGLFAVDDADVAGSTRRPGRPGSRKSSRTRMTTSTAGAKSLPVRWLRVGPNRATPSRTPTDTGYSPADWGFTTEPRSWGPQLSLSGAARPSDRSS